MLNWVYQQSPTRIANDEQLRLGLARTNYVTDLSLRRDTSGRQYPLLIQPCNNRLHQGSIRVMKTQDGANFEPVRSKRLSQLEEDSTKPDEMENIAKLVKEIKVKFQEMGHGHISPSAYDTAWVARIKSDVDPRIPEFPMCLEWVRKNQLIDGSWGEPSMYLVYDRLVNTLSCILALRQWNTGEAQIEKGLQFMRQRARDLEKESKTHMPCGFELSFSWLLKEAKDIALDLPYNNACIQEIMKLRENILKKISSETLHSVPTTVLYSLEGLQDIVQWDTVLKLQCRDGSLGNSPASTAAVYIHTNDAKCLQYLTCLVNKLGDHVDTFERLWAVDTVQRLGIHHHFKEEISEALHYIFRRCWTENGIGPAGTANLTDIDDSSMALRLLRLHGYPMSSDVLEIFKDHDGNPSSWPGGSSRAVTGMFNLYRFCQIAFPGEKILKEFMVFAEKYLQSCLRNSQVLDCWSMKKSLDKEISRALEVSWTMSLQRLEANKYIKYYGEKDIWIGKTLYRMYNVNDSKYLELAKLDYNRLLSMYQEELTAVQEWWSMSGLDAYMNMVKLKETHFGIAAALHEPDLSASRVAYIKCNCVEKLISYLFEQHQSDHDLALFCQAIEKWDPSAANSLPPTLKKVFKATYHTLNQMVVVISKAQGIDMFSYFHDLRFKQIEHYMMKRKLKGNLRTFKDHIERCKEDLGISIRLLPPLFISGEHVKESAVIYLDKKSAIQQHLASFLALFNDIQKHMNTRGKEARAQTAVDLWATKESCSEQEALSCLQAKMDEQLDELVHEVLKPCQFLPRNCRRIMLEHARIIQNFSKSGEEALRDDMECMFYSLLTIESNSHWHQQNQNNPAIINFIGNHEPSGALPPWTSWPEHAYTRGHQ